VWLCNNRDLAGHARQTQGCGCGCRCKCKCRERQSEGRIGARAVRQVKDSGARPKTLANLWSSQAPSTVSGAGWRALKAYWRPWPTRGKEAEEKAMRE
jgi:hypothetical protein